MAEGFLRDDAGSTRDERIPSDSDVHLVRSLAGTLQAPDEKPTHRQHWDHGHPLEKGQDNGEERSIAGTQP